MVRYLAFCGILIIMLLAIISRKNYSKYKDGRDPLWWLARNMTMHMSGAGKQRIRDSIRKINVLNSRKLDQETDRQITRFFHIMLVCTVIYMILLLGYTFIPREEQDMYLIDRPDIGQGEEYIEMELIDPESDVQEIYRLGIQAREYSEKEFRERARAMRTYIDSVILGENRDLEHISTDMVFPTKSEDEGLRVTWETDYPTIISNTGEVDLQDVDGSADINITATIKDDNYSEEYYITATVVESTDLSSTDIAKSELLELEEKSRISEQFVLPEQINNVQVIREGDDYESQNAQLLIFGLIIIAIFGYYRISRLREAGSMRDEEIGEAYYGFVSRLSIYMGAGFTLQRSLAAAIRNEPCKYLRAEFESSLVYISSGVSEAKVYSELGRRIGLEEYMRLMSLISQNLAYGNSNLLSLLDTEVRNSYFLKKENIRKRGEQASEKLLVPSAILMLLVIIVVMYPAFIGIK